MVCDLDQMDAPPRPAQPVTAYDLIPVGVTAGAPTCGVPWLRKLKGDKRARQCREAKRREREREKGERLPEMFGYGSTKLTMEIYSLVLPVKLLQEALEEDPDHLLKRFPEVGREHTHTHDETAEALRKFLLRWLFVR
ncbi:hypothetical protein EI171_29100 [Bradyrhizobium sp. LCT2]|uniref:hypothetical protein n=1 Tax=Bradyrhizobium sp. LCT2 TaxID=2493093 RepID=UPI00137430A4|nr:hypothetical protein [Bradyrhizobium sp. LCT2]QHP70993.1 hypothetical protein EI171_29100 [Bradyrhizobium sp. LCT2]